MLTAEWGANREAGRSAAHTKTFQGSRYHPVGPRRRSKQRALVAVGNGANASSSPNSNGYPATRSSFRRPPPDQSPMKRLRCASPCCRPPS